MPYPLKKSGPGIESKGLAYCLLDLLGTSFTIYDHTDIGVGDAQLFCEHPHSYSLMLEEESDDMAPVKSERFEEMKGEQISNIHRLFSLVTAITPWYAGSRRKETLKRGIPSLIPYIPSVIILEGA